VEREERGIEGTVVEGEGAVLQGWVGWGGRRRRQLGAEGGSGWVEAAAGSAQVLVVVEPQLSDVYGKRKMRKN
jgi:hypothetical protein